MKPHLAPVELLHAAGAPNGTAVLGDVPDWLAPISRCDAAPDVVLVRARRSAAVEQGDAIGRRLSTTGIVIAFGPPADQKALAGALMAHGVSFAATVVASRPRTIRGGRGISIVASQRASRRRSDPLRAARAFLDPRHEVANATVLLRGAGGPVASWLPGTGEVVHVRTSWRGNEETAIAVRTGGLPSLYAKVGLGETTKDIGAKELRALTVLRRAAGVAGARVPAVEGLVHLDDRPVALLSALDGRPVAQASARSARRAAGETVAWLGRFANETRSEAPGGLLLDGAVLEPANLLVRGLDGGTAYIDRLRRLADSCRGSTLPTAASHGDLTLWNVLEGDPIGIVDWEGAHDVDVPFVDFPYLVVDAAYWTSRHRDRVRAFLHCFPNRVSTIDVRAVGASGVEMPEAFAELAFHACWLKHAADEQSRGLRGPFSEILQTIVGRATA